MTTEQSVALAERHHETFLDIQGNAVELTALAWDSLEDYADAAETWAELWLPVSDAAVDAALVSTDAYFAAATDTGDLGLGGLTAPLLRDIGFDTYAHRPLATLYTALSQGRAFEDALQAARNRAMAMIAADVSMGQRYAANEWVKANRIVGYRRTLTGASCALCAVASTQRYTRANLMEIHPNCDCGVAEVRGEDDPGQVINQPLLDSLKAQGGPKVWDRPYGVGEDGRLHRRVTEVVRDASGQPVINKETGKPRTRMALGAVVSPQVRNHGELGPVLWAPGDHFLDLN